MIFADIKLARRIEAAEAAGAEANSHAMKRVAPELNPATLRIAGGVALFAGASSPLTQAIGLGMNGPVTHEEIATLEEFYRGRNSAAVVDLCPLSDPSLLAILRERDFRLTEFTNMLARELTDTTDFAPPDGIEISAVSQPEGNVWARTVFTSFFEGAEPPPEILTLAKVIQARPDVTCVLARIDGEPACGGTLILCEGLGGLYGTGTLPGMRGRGGQGALIRARLVMAAQTGCDLANSSTLPGTTSQRNLERNGFQVVYSKAQFVKDFASAP